MDTYEKDILQFRKSEDEEAISDPLHWINLVGLFWLEEGENSFGSSPEAKISLAQFPKPISGSFLFKNGKVTVRSEAGMTMNSGSLEARPLFTDKDKQADLLDIGTLTLKIIIRGKDTLVRVWDRNSETQRNFSGFKYYPVRPEYKVIAKYTRYDPPRPTIRVEGIGTEVPTFFLGQAQFILNGVECILEAEQSGEKLLFNFKDETNQDDTYGGGRKFYLPPPEGDEIALDFNLTENWPCAYTPYATCPIPPRENKLSVRIEAGEKRFKE